MAHHVYANDNEIASKSAAGKSSAAFPDTCFSPPTPPAGGVPIPYPNTCFARDISNGSRTVFIAGMEIALQHKSYFRTSTGDEPSTPGLKKGINSGRIKGKCYFVSWSPNVKVEGLCVTRHLDWVTHNHSNPANTPPNQYISERMPGDACRKDREAIAKKCKEKKAEDADKKKAPNARKRSLGKRLGNIASIPDDAAKKAMNYKRQQGGMNSWVDDYCDGLWVKPMNGVKAFEEAKKQIDELAEILTMGPMELSAKIFGELLDLAYERMGGWFIVRKAGGLVGRSVLKNLIGGVAGATGVGLVVTGAMAAWTVADVINTAKDIAEALGPEGQEMLDDLMDMEKLKEKAKEKLGKYKESPDKAVADLMSMQAAKSPCLRARKCMLVPYNQTGARKAAKSGKGCCPGQTGHHVIPGAVFKDNSCYTGKHRGAPTLCVEGVNNAHGSHGASHTALEEKLGRQGFPNGTPISYGQMRDTAIDAAKDAGAGDCDPKCLQAQLDEYYKGCNEGTNKNLRAHSGKNSSDSVDSARDDSDNSSE
ncbi:PAAR-like domain-containing protein [Pseudomonas aeruginosa]